MEDTRSVELYWARSAARRATPTAWRTSSRPRSGSSLWLDEDVPYRQDALDTLAGTYYASTNQGEMGSAQLNKTLQKWLNVHTGGRLAGQDVRVGIDEDGVTAVAYTILSFGAGAAEPPDEEIDFTLDRPFVFAITSQDGLPLFIGVVNTPN